MTKPSGDLPAFSISNESLGSPRIEVVYDSLVRYSAQVMNWYLIEKEKKARASKAIGFATILVGALGALVPLAAPLASGLNPSLGYVLLAIAGALQVIDRYRGYSKSWTRYVESAMAINANLVMLQVEWEKIGATVGSGTAAQWELLASHASELGVYISSETKRWSDLLESESKDIVNKLSTSSKS